MRVRTCCSTWQPTHWNRDVYKRQVLLRAVADSTVQMYEYTHMPTHMRAPFSVEEMRSTT